jgi:diguanylate cyclase (GGDEF)-like protein
VRDPRLAEIEFLMRLERDQQISLSTSENDNSRHLVGESTGPWYGLTMSRFRAMVLNLLQRDLVVGVIGTEEPKYVWSETELALELERRKLMWELLKGNRITLHLSHAGRIHLWNQRDALLRDPDFEPFGLRSRTAWDRDLFLRLQWATQEAPLSLMFLDLDNFGRVNKEHGAPVGDAVLRLVFGLVSSVAGTRGAAYRYGGEEVGVLFPGIDLTTAASLAEELRALIEHDVHVRVPQLEVPQTASIGVAEFTGPIENDVAVARVDELMRRAKKQGKNRVVIDDDAATTAATTLGGEAAH